MENDKPEKGLHERVARLERAVQALLNASTETSESDAFTDEGLVTLNGIVAQDDWG